MLFSLGKVSK